MQITQKNATFIHIFLKKPQPSMGRIDILSASAGSGKTHRLAYNYIKLVLNEPHNYRHILAVTFTNKATDELKSRILMQLNCLASGKKSKFDQNLREDNYDLAFVRKRAAEACNLILHDYNNFAVMTIDKFFQRIMRSFIRELGIDLSFNLEIKVDSLLEQAVDRVLEDITSDTNLYKWILHYIGENIAEGTSWDIRGEITSLGKELFSEEFKKSHITSDDKPELEQLASALLAKSKMLEELYRSEAKRFIALLDKHMLLASHFSGGNQSGLVAKYVEPVAAGIVKEPNPAAIKALNNGAWHNKGKSPAYATIDSIEHELHSILSSMVELHARVEEAINTKSAILSHYRDFALLADLSSRLQEICREGDILPLAEVGGLISKLVAGNDTPFIYEKAGNRFDYFMIDEFQDTSTMQWLNFVPLLHNALSQSEENPVLLVGDVKQSIYRWRGGDWSLLAHQVAKEFDDVRTEPLIINRRSTREVVTFNNGLTAHALGNIAQGIEASLNEASQKGYVTPALHKELTTMATDAYSDYRQEFLPDSEEGYVTVMAYGKKKSRKKKGEEAPEEEPIAQNEGEEDNTPLHPVVARIEELQSRGYKAKDIAILVRRNVEAEEIASLLLSHKNNPNRDPRYVFDVVSQDALNVGSSKSVQFIIACMNIATKPDDNISRALYNDYLSRTFESELPEEEQTFLTSLAMMHPEEIFNLIVIRFPQCSTQSEVPYVQALHSQIIDYCSRNIADTPLFVKWWQKNGASKSVTLPEDANAITIITIHKAKGLGFPAVIIPYCNWSLAPLSNSIFWATPNTPFNPDDNILSYPVEYNSSLGRSRFSHSYYTEKTLAAIDALNALYVAITRAERELHIMVSATAGDNTVGKSVREFAKVEEDGDMTTYGTATIFISEKKPTPSLSEFATYHLGNKVSVRYPHQRYTEEAGGNHLSPRDFGILMHQAMENATTMEDVHKQIALHITNGLLSEEEAETLRRQIDSATQNPLVAEWFGGEWDSVKSECEIIASGYSKRPDRVMIRGKKAVVVDYKFGLIHEKDHTDQILHYAELLGQMGYTDVSGYLWYITLGEINQVV